MKKILFLVIFITIATPSVTYASWWNPFTWSLLKQSHTNQMQATRATSTASLLDNKQAPQGIDDLRAENERLRNELKRQVGGKNIKQGTAAASVKTLGTQGIKKQVNCDDIKRNFVEVEIPKINEIFIAKRKDEGVLVTKLKNQEAEALISAGKTAEANSVFDKYLSYWKERLTKIEQERKVVVKNAYQKILASTAPHCKDNLIVEDLKGATDVKFIQQPTVQIPVSYSSYPSYQYSGTIRPSVNYSGTSNSSGYNRVNFESPKFPSAVPPRTEIRMDDINTDFGSVRTSDGNFYQIHCQDGLNGKICSKI